MDLLLKDKTAFIMASSSGLGKAIAQELANEGANVMLTGRSVDKLKAAKEEIEDAGGSAAYMVMDQTQANEVSNAVKQTREKFGPISILVNNSGGPSAGSFQDFEDKDWQDAYELTLLSYVRVIREVLPDLIETKGRILNNTSSSIKAPVDGLTLSNVFRMGISGLSKSLSQELAPKGILVNTIGPGRIQTDRIDHLDQVKASNTNQSFTKVRENSLNGIPLGRLGEPAEFAKTATFLVSGANTYVTGQTILVDGGMVKAY